MTKHPVTNEIRMMKSEGCKSGHFGSESEPLMGVFVVSFRTLHSNRWPVMSIYFNEINARIDAIVLARLMSCDW